MIISLTKKSGFSISSFVCILILLKLIIAGNISEFIYNWLLFSVIGYIFPEFGDIKFVWL